VVFGVVGAGQVAGFASLLRGVFGGDAKEVLVIGFQFYDFENEVRFGVVGDFRENAGDRHGMFRVDFDFTVFGACVFAYLPEERSSLELDELRDVDI